MHSFVEVWRPMKFKCLFQILYLIFDYPHKHYTFKYFEV